jgi:hypothetical protein
MASDPREREGIDPALGSPVDATSSRSTPAIIAIATGVALVGGVLTTVVWLGFMAVVFGGDGETDGVSVLGFLALGLGTVLVVTLVLYLGAGFRMIRQQHPQGQRTRPRLMLLSVPVLAVLAVVLFNG